MIITCAHCGDEAERHNDQVLRARKHNRPMYCCVECFYLSRRNPDRTDKERERARRNQAATIGVRERVSRADGILPLLRRTSAPITASAIAQRLGIAHKTAHVRLGELAARGEAARDANGEWYAVKESTVSK